MGTDRCLLNLKTYKMKVFIFTLIIVLLGLTSARVPGNAVSKCEDVLSEKICATLRQTAQEVKQKIEVIDHLVVKAVKEHLKDAEAIVQKVRQQLAEMAKKSQVRRCSFKISLHKIESCC